MRKSRSQVSRRQGRPVSIEVAIQRGFARDGKIAKHSRRRSCPWEAAIGSLLPDDGLAAGKERCEDKTMLEGSRSGRVRLTSSDSRLKSPYLRQTNTSGIPALEVRTRKSYTPSFSSASDLSGACKSNECMKRSTDLMTLVPHPSLILHTPHANDVDLKAMLRLDLRLDSLTPHSPPRILLQQPQVLLPDPHYLLPTHKLNGRSE
jgi:hypothetical protein